jgi:site-specific recombinase XerD
MTADVLPAPAAGAVAERDALAAFTEQWLAKRRFAENTRDGYRRDVTQWNAWCEDVDLDPLKAHFTDVDTWARELESDEGGPALSAATVARKMSAVSSWYSYLVKLGVIPLNPAAAADRPEVDRDFSPTVAPTGDEAERMLELAADNVDAIGDVGPLLAAWLLDMGTRASETTRIDLADLGIDRGHRIVLLLNTKGGRRRKRTIPPQLAELLDRYLATRAARAGVAVSELSGALFVDTKDNPIDRHAVYRFIRRLAKRAGLENWEKITPHSFRHAFCAIAREEGVPLEDRQDAMGHRDPRTTRRYDRSLQNLARDPSMIVAERMARRRDEAEED